MRATGVPTAASNLAWVPGPTVTKSPAASCRTAGLGQPGSLNLGPSHHVITATRDRRRGAGAMRSEPEAPEPDPSRKDLPHRQSDGVKVRVREPGSSKP